MVPAAAMAAAAAMRPLVATLPPGAPLMPPPLQAPRSSLGIPPLAEPVHPPPPSDPQPLPLPASVPLERLPSTEDSRARLAAKLRSSSGHSTGGSSSSSSGVAPDSRVVEPPPRSSQAPRPTTGAWLPSPATAPARLVTAASAGGLPQQRPSLLRRQPPASAPVPGGAAVNAMLQGLDANHAAQHAAREQQLVQDSLKTERKLRRRERRRQKRAISLAAAEADAEHGAIESLGGGTEALELILAMTGSVVRRRRRCQPCCYMWLPA